MDGFAALALLDREIDLAAGQRRAHGTGAVEGDEANPLGPDAERIEQSYGRDMADRSEIDRGAELAGVGLDGVEQILGRLERPILGRHDQSEIDPLAIHEG